MRSFPEISQTNKNDIINDWRDNIQPGSYDSPIKGPLNPPAVALETPSASNRGRAFNFFEFPDFEKPQLSRLSHEPDSQIQDSRVRSTTVENNTWHPDIHRKPLPERYCSSSLEEKIKGKDSQGARSPVTYASPNSQRLCSPDNHSILDLDEPTPRTTPNLDDGTVGNVQVRTQKRRRPDLRVMIPKTLAGDVILLHGNPFSLKSADSTLTRSSICAPSHGDVMRKMPQGKLARNAELSRSTPSVNASITQIETANISIPIFPYAHLTTRCKSKDCPISGQHEKGPYLHEGKLRTRDGMIFGASNPPPEVWDAYDRLRHGISNAPEDVRLVDGFKKFHFGFAQQESMQVLNSPARSLAGSWKLPSRAGGLLGRLMRLGARRRK